MRRRPRVRRETCQRHCGCWRRWKRGPGRPRTRAIVQVRKGAVLIWISVGSKRVQRPSGGACRECPTTMPHYICRPVSGCPESRPPRRASNSTIQEAIGQYRLAVTIPVSGTGAFARAPRPDPDAIVYRRRRGATRRGRGHSAGGGRCRARSTAVWPASHAEGASPALTCAATARRGGSCRRRWRCSAISPAESQSRRPFGSFRPGDRCLAGERSGGRPPLSCLYGGQANSSGDISRSDASGRQRLPALRWRRKMSRSWNSSSARMAACST